MPLPEGLSFEQAAPIFCAGYTVWSGLRWGAPQPGDRVAVLGIGGLGHLALQYAKAAGLHTIGASGKVRVVTETYRLDEIGKAYERVEKGKVRFRAVVTM